MFAELCLWEAVRRLVARASGRCRPALMNETNACCWPSPPFFCNMAIFDGISVVVVWQMQSGCTSELSFNAKFMKHPL